MEPKLIIKCTQLDFELTELLGEKSTDFIVLLADGVQLEFFGTPVDSPNQRRVYQNIVEELNKKTAMGRTCRHASSSISATTGEPEPPRGEPNPASDTRSSASVASFLCTTKKSSHEPQLDSHKKANEPR